MSLCVSEGLFLYKYRAVARYFHLRRSFFSQTWVTGLMNFFARKLRLPVTKAQKVRALLTVSSVIVTTGGEAMCNNRNSL
jgi:hypothetical protein